MAALSARQTLLGNTAHTRQHGGEYATRRTPGNKAHTRYQGTHQASGHTPGNRAHTKQHGAHQASGISKKYFRPGGMTPSEWTRSVRAVRDIPVAAYSAPSANTTLRVAYRPPIAVSPFLLALSVSNFERTLWR